MARSRIDWEAIEADYRIGSISVNQLAKNHGITEGAIRKKAYRGNWPRDLSARIKAVADRKLLVAQGKKESSTNEVREVRTAVSEENEIALVERAASLQADIVIRHRKKFDDLNVLAINLDSKFSLMLDQSADNRDIAMAVQTFKSLVETRSKIVAMERQSYKITDDVNEEDQNKKVVVNVNFV